MKKVAKAVLISTLLALSGGIVVGAEEITQPAISQSDQILALEIRRLLSLDEVVEVMSQEAVISAGDGAEGLTPEQQESWRQGIARINRSEHLQQLMRDGLENALIDRDPTQLRKALLFYQSNLGRQVVQLELSARRAMVDPEGKEAAIAAAADASTNGRARLAMIDRLMSASNVVDINVAGSLNAMMAVNRGFAAALQEDLGPMDTTADAWQEEPAIRADIQEWVQALLYLAYSPLDDRKLDEVIHFVASDEGQELADVLSLAFDGMFTRIAYETGMMSGAIQLGEEL